MTAMTAATTTQGAGSTRAERRRRQGQRGAPAAAAAAEGEGGGGVRARGEKRKRRRGASAGRLQARGAGAAADDDDDSSTEAFASADDDDDSFSEAFASADDDDDNDDSDSPKAFATSMAKILGSTLKVADRKAPILAKSRGIERRIEEEKLENKARKAIASEKKRLASKDRVLPDPTRLDYESKLKKVAARGVVTLFNAINEHHKTDTPDTVGKSAATKEKVASMSKASFLELLKSGNPAVKS